MRFDRICRYGLWLGVLLAGCDAGSSGTPPQTPPPGSNTAASTATAAAATAAPAAPRETQTIALPGGAPGIGFDDLRFCSFPDSFDAILAPAGRSGNVDFIDPASGRVTPLSGFSTDAAYGGGHDFGVTSADGDFDGLFAVDRTSKKLYLADPVAKKIVGTAPLAASPDYVRYFVPFRQAWVTEPDAEQIEVFDMPKVGDMNAAFSVGGAPVREAVISLKGGPESLVFDIRRSKAYTHLWAGQTVSIEASTQKVLYTWPNGCQKSRGIALDETRGLLFVGCGEGKAVVLDVEKGGKQISSIDTGGAGVDIIAFAEGLRHLYVPSGEKGILAIVGVSEKGALSLLGTVPAAAGAHCVAADKNGNAYVCDPAHGAILKIPDPYPATK